VRAAGAVRLTVPEAGWLRSKSNRGQGTGTGKLGAIGTLVVIWTERSATGAAGCSLLRPGVPYVPSCQKTYVHGSGRRAGSEARQHGAGAFGGANGKPEAAMQYSIQGLNCDDPGRKTC
jgi:hypothetical protein